MKTVIFTQRVEIIESYNERRDCADQRIAEFIKECGFLPIPIPNNPDILNDAISQIEPCGIILTGGNSLVKYGGNAPERDSTDKALIEIAINQKIPLYGFCRGMQSILDYFGQTLQNIKNHVAVRHLLESDIWQEREVNSYHNQACLNIENTDLTILAKTSDGVVEAITHKNYNIAATMWHPERETTFDKRDIEFVQKLFLRRE